MTDNERIAVGIMGFEIQEWITPNGERTAIIKDKRGSWIGIHSDTEKDENGLDKIIYKYPERGCFIPKYDSSLEACFEMEERIKENGWSKNYYVHLLAVVDHSTGEFQMTHATAAQRTAAAIAMLDEVKK